MYARNLGLMLLVAGGLHLYFHKFRRRRMERKFDPRDAARQAPAARRAFVTASGYIPGEGSFDTLACADGSGSRGANTSPTDTGSADWFAPTDRSDS